MSSSTKLDPTGERAEATEAMESTPISGKDHEYQADGDHRPRQRVEGSDGDRDGRAQATDVTAPKVGVEKERHISDGIPGAGQSPDANATPAAQRKNDPSA